MDSDDLYLQPRHREWASRSCVKLLKSCKESIQTMAISQEEVTQRDLYKKLRQACSTDAVLNTIERRASHFIRSSTMTTANTFVNNIKMIASHVQPFILSSVLKTICNSWPTSRRFMAGQPHCRFGCYAAGGDDVRHYPFCPVVIRFVTTVCNTTPEWIQRSSLRHFLMLEAGDPQDALATALWCDIVLNAYHAIRTSRSRTSPEGALRARVRIVATRIPRAANYLSLR